jgi:predicted amidophosphoribosyltransferase
LDHLHYLDFDEIEQFGKTCLGTLVHYAKQSQNKRLMSRLMDRINIPVGILLEHLKADAIGFIPPAIRREAQLMKYLQTYLDVPLPIVEIRRINGLIPIPQQSLSNSDERIRNADNSFTVTGRRSFEHLVLIDDVVNSGATLNEVAAKIKTKNIANVVTGLAIVGPSNHPTV